MELRQCTPRPAGRVVLPLARRCKLFFANGIPAEAGRDGRTIVFALHHEWSAAIVEAKDFIVQVEAIHDEGEAVSQSNAALSVNLKMSVEVVVAEWALNATVGTILKLVSGNVGVVIREADADGDTATIVCGADVPGVGCVSEQARMIRPAIQTADSRRGVSIVRRNAQASEWARQKGEVLEVSDLKAIEPGTSSVTGLRKRALGYSRTRAVCGAEGAGMNDAGSGDDGIGEILVKITGSDHAEVTEIMFEKQVNVVGGLSLKIRIAERNKDIGKRRIVNGNGLSDFLGIGTGEPTAVNQTNVRIASERIANRGTGQNLQIRTIVFVESEEGIVLVKNGSGGVEVGAFEANAGDQTNLVEVDGVHHVAGADFFNQVELAGSVFRHRVVGGAGSIVGGKGIENSGEPWIWAEFVSAAVIIVVGEAIGEAGKSKIGAGAGWEKIIGKGVGKFVGVAEFAANFNGG